jgi:hypothetical protein
MKNSDYIAGLKTRGFIIAAFVLLGALLPGLSGCDNRRAEIQQTMREYPTWLKFIMSRPKPSIRLLKET